MRPRPAQAACRRSRPPDAAAEPADRGRKPQCVDQADTDYSPSAVSIATRQRGTRSPSHLVSSGARVVAVELHPTRANVLRTRFRHQPVVVAEADAADLRLPRRPFSVVANPPFAVTTALLRRLLGRGSRRGRRTSWFRLTLALDGRADERRGRIGGRRRTSPESWAGCPATRGDLGGAGRHLCASKPGGQRRAAHRAPVAAAFRGPSPMAGR
jgi:hypothetical protein